jgi:hypothetical protein
MESKMGKSDEDLILEMSLGMGGVAEGGGAVFGEEDDDLDVDLTGELEDDLDVPGEPGGDEESVEGEEVSVDKEELRSLFEKVEMGEMSPQEALDQCCGGVEDLGIGGDEGPEGPPGPGLDLDEGPGLDDNPFDECAGGMYESIGRIASMLTDDPDILKEEEKKKPKPCPECKKVQIPPSVSMCRKCDQKLRTPPPAKAKKTGGKPPKKLEDPDNPAYND